MAQPVLVGYDPETFDRAPVRLGAAISRATGAPLTIGAVYAGGPAVDRLAAGEFGGELETGAQRALDHVRTELREQRIDARIELVEGTSSAQGLVGLIESMQPALVVLGSTHRGKVRRVLPGSTAERVIHGASCPVAIAPRGYEPPPGGLRMIGAAYAPTAEGREALRAAGLIAHAAAARVEAILVLPPKLAEHQAPGLMAAEHHDGDPAAEAGAARDLTAAERDLRAAIAELSPDGDVEPDLLFQDPADGLVAASESLDLLVMGSRAYGPMKAVMLGGVSRQVIARAACPVLVIPRGTDRRLDALLAAV
jgi:nucleotide-binding universal stress UspA family protein